MNTDEAVSRSAALIAALAEIPIDELVACARENLKATYPVRVSKTESREAPDYTVRQKALEWISAQRGATTPQNRKVPDPIQPASGKGAAAGKLKPRDAAEPSAGAS